MHGSIARLLSVGSVTHKESSAGRQARKTVKGKGRAGR